MPTRGKKEARKVRLQFKPRRAPKWWPRAGRRLRWVGVLGYGNGWTLGPGDPIPAGDKEVVILLLEEEHGAIEVREEPYPARQMPLLE